MLLNDLLLIKKNIMYPSTLMGLDVSKNYIGIAASDSTLSIAFPITTIKRTKLLEDLSAILKIIKSKSVYGIIIGLPLELNGKEEKRAQSIKAFSYNLDKFLKDSYLDMPIYFEDERYSTIFAKDSIKNNNTSVDDKAAAWFLQNFLDKLKQK